MPVKGIRARRVRRLLGAVGLFSIVIVATLAGRGAAQPAVPTLLLETPGCGRATVTPTPPAPTVWDNGVSVPIVAFIPPTVFVWVDDLGVASRVTTNTGCAPRSGDRFLVELGGRPEAAEAAPAASAAEVMAHRFSADWREPGRWHEL
jgi:hypothetical protein